MAESGQFGRTKVCAGIVSTVLVEGEATAVSALAPAAETVAMMLEKHELSGRNFRGIRLLGGKAEQVLYM